MCDLKTCSVCKECKPNTLEFFDIKDGGKTTARCRGCRKLANNERRKTTPKHVINDRARKYRSRPEVQARAKNVRSQNTEKERLRHEKYRRENAEHIKQQGKTYRLAIKAQLREKSRKFYAENKVSESERKRADRLKDPAKYAARSREYYLENKPKVLAKSTARELLKISRTPKYLTPEDLFLIQEFYILARQRSLATGVKWEVDHIAPLKGGLISGLHMPWNLQVIPMKINRSKRDKFTPGDFPVKTNFFGD